MKKNKYKYVILGAGVSGLTTAYELSQVFPGEVLVLEKDDTTGGLCKTINKNNSLYDLGSHRIHFQVKEKQLNYISGFYGNKLMKNTRKGKLRLRKSYISYPINLAQFIISLGWSETLRCGMSLIWNRITGLFITNAKKNSSYRNNLIYKAGERAYKIFYEPYAIKVWGQDPSRLSVTVVKKRVSMTKPLIFIRDIFIQYLKERNINYYYYPENGIGDFAKNIEKKLLQNQAEIITDVVSFDLSDKDDNKFISLLKKSKDAVTIEYETLISTIPIDDLLFKLGGDEAVNIAGKILWRGLKLIYLHVDKEPLFEGETFYFPETKYVFGRVSIPKRFSGKMQVNNHYTCLVCEIPCSEKSSQWEMPPSDLYERCLNDLKTAMLLEENTITITEMNFIIDLPKVYPMYTIGWQENIDQALDYLGRNNKNIFSSGKCGFFLHCNMDHSIEIGYRLARYITEGRSPSEWYLNLDDFNNLKLRD